MWDRNVWGFKTFKKFLKTYLIFSSALSLRVCWIWFSLRGNKMYAQCSIFGSRGFFISFLIPYEFPNIFYLLRWPFPCALPSCELLFKLQILNQTSSYPRSLYDTFRQHFCCIYPFFITVTIFHSSQRGWGPVFFASFFNFQSCTVPSTEKIPNQYRLNEHWFRNYLFRIYYVTDPVVGAANKAFNQTALCMCACSF